MFQEKREGVKTQKEELKVGFGGRWPFHSLIECELLEWSFQSEVNNLHRQLENWKGGKGPVFTCLFTV